MIGKNEWFSRRKYGGWGLTPKTWQGYVYIIVFILITYGLLNIPGISGTYRLPIAYVWIAVVCLDLLHIMVTLKKDELEVKIEALAERNAAWTMIIALVLGFAYKTAQSAALGIPAIDWYLAAPLIGGAIAKSLTNIWLEHRGV